MNNKVLLVIFVTIFLCSIIAVPQISYCQTTPDTLTVALNSPADNTTSTTTSNVLSYNPVITGASDYFVAARLYVNGTPTTAMNSTAILNNTANTITYDFAANGTYVWNIQVANSTMSVSATNSFTLTVAVPGPTAAPTETPTPTPAPTATPTATAVPITIASATPTAWIPTTGTPTATSKPKLQNGINFILIGGLAAIVAVIVGGGGAFVSRKRKKVNEKNLRKFSSRNFRDYVIKRFNGKPSDSDLGIDGFTMGGQPLLIRQSDNVGQIDIEDFSAAIAKGKAKKGTIVAFNFASDAIRGKVKAKMNYGIEIQTLPIDELVNANYANTIRDIANTHVDFESMPPEDIGPEIEGKEESFAALEDMTKEPQGNGMKKPLVFISHSKNTKIVDQVKSLLDFCQYEYSVAEETETTGIPIPDNVFGLMRDCDCAIITVGADDQERRSDGSYVLNSNVLTEISGAYLKYNMQVILLVDRRVQLPSNLQGLKRIEYLGDDLIFTTAMDLQKLLVDFRKM